MTNIRQVCSTIPVLRLIAAVVALCLPLSTTAQEVSECDWRASARNLVEPWSQTTRTFANGKTRLTLIDIVEPAAGAYFLMILSPPYDEMEDRQCRLIGFSGGTGYAGMDFAKLEAGYDPARGLVFTLPAMIYLPEKGFANSALLKITLNQSSGAITVDHQLGRE